MSFLRIQPPPQPPAGPFTGAVRPDVAPAGGAHVGGVGSFHAAGNDERAPLVGHDGAVPPSRIPVDGAPVALPAHTPEGIAPQQGVGVVRPRRDMIGVSMGVHAAHLKAALVGVEPPNLPLTLGEKFFNFLRSSQNTRKLITLTVFATIAFFVIFGGFSHLTVVALLTVSFSTLLGMQLVPDLILESHEARMKGETKMDAFRHVLKVASSPSMFIVGTALSIAGLFVPALWPLAIAAVSFNAIGFAVMYGVVIHEIRTSKSLSKGRKAALLSMAVILPAAVAFTVIGVNASLIAHTAISATQFGGLALPGSPEVVGYIADKVPAAFQFAPKAAAYLVTHAFEFMLTAFGVFLAWGFAFPEIFGRGVAEGERNKALREASAAEQIRTGSLQHSVQDIDRKRAILAHTLAEVEAGRADRTVVAPSVQRLLAALSQHFESHFTGVLARIEEMSGTQNISEMLRIERATTAALAAALPEGFDEHLIAAYNAVSDRAREGVAGGWAALAVVKAHLAEVLTREGTDRAARQDIDMARAGVLEKTRNAVFALAMEHAEDVGSLRAVEGDVVA